MSTGAATVVFAGPTIDAGTVHGVLGADCTVFGPARQGDVMRAWRSGARVIAIVDGYFQSVPAVWHKEILWAIANGVHVLGAASMGALRAAELHTFGMIGVGTVFEWFRDGQLVRDDEVAVAHAAAEHGYRHHSEALVNIRATLREAVRAGVLDEAERDAVLAEGTRRFYPDRHWPSLCEELGRSHGADAGARLEAFLRGGGRVDLKRRDADALLDLLSSDQQRWAVPAEAAFTLSHTVWFDHLHARSGQFAGQPGVTAGAGRVTRSDIEDELRLHRYYRPALRAALVRCLTSDEADRRKVETSPEQVADYANAVCRDLGLTDQAAFDRWLSTNGLTVAEFNELMERELRRNLVMSQLSQSAHHEMPDALRLAGLWPAVSARAARKVQLLDDAGLADPALVDTGLASHDELVAWWLSRIAKATSTVSRDPETLGRLADFADSASFVQALLREYCAEQLGLAPLDDREVWW